MNFELSGNVYCHDLINPPASDRSCDINLELENRGQIQLIKEQLTNTGTKYLLKIPYAKSIGFTSSELHTVSYEFENLILAFNLVLDRVCMTSRLAEFSKQTITPEKALHSVEVTRTEQKIIVKIIEENINIHDEVHATVIHSAKVEEKKIIDAFHLLQKTNLTRTNKNFSIRENNLKKSIENYSNAMDDKSKVLKFRDLFTAFELYVNSDGVDRKGDLFDNTASTIFGSQPNKVKEWRELYNRVKHADRNRQDINTYYKTERILSEELKVLRTSLQGTLLSEVTHFGMGTNP